MSSLIDMISLFAFSTLYPVVVIFRMLARLTFSNLQCGSKSNVLLAFMSSGSSASESFSSFE